MRYEQIRRDAADSRETVREILAEQALLFHERRRAADDPAIYICLECFAEFRAEPVGEVDADAADNNGQYGLFTASDEE